MNARQQRPPRPGHRSRPGSRPRPKAAQAAAGVWIYGVHAALAALANPRRHITRLLVEGEALAARAVAAADVSGRARPAAEMPEKSDWPRLLGHDAVHQGIAVEAAPLAAIRLEDLLARAAEVACLIVLDQATDPRNVGAVMRSAAAFGALAVIVQDRHAPPVTGALAKAASGALETIPLIRTGNVARALEAVKQAGFWCIGLDGAATVPLAEAPLTGRAALVLGAEDQGLRRLVGETCDVLACIDMAPAEASGIDSLNLSNAAAVALYEWARQNRAASEPHR